MLIRFKILRDGKDTGDEAFCTGALTEEGARERLKKVRIPSPEDPGLSLGPAIEEEAS